eukprot:GHVN01066886.1.p1 GENE.GHVN01066886.1~~GHVN01066886.1.p1  ORF type:complete len:341 (-),score=45.85 GHVN01066886.1:69-1091(-)
MLCVCGCHLENVRHLAMVFLVELDTIAKGSEKVAVEKGTLWLATSSQGLVEFRVRQKWSLQQGKRHIVGRNPQGADIVLPHQSMSRSHIAIIVEKQKGKDCVKVEDLGSANGTWVALGEDSKALEANIPIESADFDKTLRMRFGQNPYMYSICTVDPGVSPLRPRQERLTNNHTSDSGVSEPVPEERQMSSSASVSHPQRPRKRFASKWDDPSDSPPPASASSFKQPHVVKPASSFLTQREAFVPSTSTSHHPSRSESSGNGDTCGSKSHFLNSFGADSSKRTKFLKLMGLKGTELPPEKSAITPAKRRNEEADLTADLERQYCDSMKYRDAKKTGLGGV